MRIGIVGEGRVGTALATGWKNAGHEVRTASRSGGDPIADVAAWSEVLVFAVPWKATESVADAVGPIHGKIVIDCTNPVVGGPNGPELALGHNTSGAERLQMLLPDALVVKTLNQVGAEVMADTKGFACPPLQFLAGDNDAAKKTVSGLLTDLGFEPLDAGGLEKARLLEPFALTWINQALVKGKGRNWAFGAMERKP